MKRAVKFLLVCTWMATCGAQFEPQQQFSLNGDSTELDRRRQLSPQQQGHILSDIQQHQHRFQLHQNLLKEQQRHQQQQQLLQQQQQPLQQPPQLLQQLPQPQFQQAFPPPTLATPDQLQTQHPESLLQPQLPLVHQNHQFNSHTNGPPLDQFLGVGSGFLTQPVLTQQTLTQPTTEPDPQQEQRLKELRLKQQIIEKHNQFVEKQYEKALKKAQEDHQQWLDQQREQRKKLYQTLYRPNGPRILNFMGSKPRLVFPEEIPLFQQAVNQYYLEHPTTTTTTTTTTTPAPPTSSTHEPDEDLDQLLEASPEPKLNLYDSELVFPGPRAQTKLPSNHFLPTALPESKAKPIKSIEQLDLLQKQYQQHLLQRDDLLRQLKEAIAENPDEPSKNFTSREVSLPNGQTVQIIKTTDPNLIPGGTPINSEDAIKTEVNGQTVQIIQTADPKLIAEATAVKPTVSSTTTGKPPKVLLEELTKGVLPPGADFEVLKHTASGAVEELGALPSNLPNQKKVTFVLLEEQQDGSYKVQGVRGNAKDQKEKESVDVESILDRIKSGELKLPPHNKPSSVSPTPIAPTPTVAPKTVPPSENTSIVHDIKPQSTIYPSPTNIISYQSANNQKPLQLIPFANVVSTPKTLGTVDPSITYSSSSSRPPVPASATALLNSAIATPQVRILENSKSTPYVSGSTTPRPLSSLFPSSTEYFRLSSTSAPVTPLSATIRTPPFPSSNSAQHRFSAPPSVSLSTSAPYISSPGPRISPPGSYVSSPSPNIGPSNSNIGSSSSQFGNSNSHIGLSNSQFGNSNSHIGLSNSQFGNSNSQFGNSNSHIGSSSSQFGTSNSHIGPINSNIGSSNSPIASSNSHIAPSNSHVSSPAPQVPSPTSQYPDDYFEATGAQPQTQSLPLTELLKKKGLFAMAKFLKQSGLDTILNETGPYTIFVPTDKAFRNLLIQLGGPEKAEEKFKENPRLLSGLLLHHVIPGAFEIGQLQDEMTGVSLAGTQLRVNQYSQQDPEWNEIKVTTINGAKVLTDKHDITIPQGVAHAIDRVMFPLPVGDLVQTLQSDRERRFTTFLRLIFAAGLADTLQSSRTYTAFAPVDRAFAAGLSTERLSELVTDKTAAQDFVKKHLIHGTLYTNGMRFYQIRDTLQPGKQITVNKTSGRIKVNNQSLVTQNVPSTNGVIHALDSLL